MKPMNWNCPYCGRAQVVTDQTYTITNAVIWNNLSKYGRIGARIESIVCSNIECKELSLTFYLKEVGNTPPRGFYIAEYTYHYWKLLPESNAKPQPEYIPTTIIENYNQACRIRDLSPNASATMSRRCLQGMIRDFCKISKPTLAKEIETLREQISEGKGPQGVSNDTMEAIDHVRRIGAIGAHMEKDINLILDVEPDEAQTLINLIELLFEDWYVVKHEREARLMELGVVVENKEAKKAEAKLSPPSENEPPPHTN